MALPIPAVQQALKKDGLDGWLLYDFHGSNPIARRLTDLASSSKMASPGVLCTRLSVTISTACPVTRSRTLGVTSSRRV
jgi:hypothetical protein